MKALLATLALTLSSLSFGQQGSLPVTCGVTEAYHKILEESGEQIGFVGEGENENEGRIYTIVSSNEDFGTWTVALVSPVENLVCIVAFGHKHSFDQE